MKRIEVTCTQCGGTGHRPLSSLYTRTFELVRKHGPVTGAALARIDKCKGEAMNNRLVVLMRHGLLTAERDGRKVFYEVRK